MLFSELGETRKSLLELKVMVILSGPGFAGLLVYTIKMHRISWKTPYSNKYNYTTKSFGNLNKSRLRCHAVPATTALLSFTALVQVMVPGS